MISRALQQIEKAYQLQLTEAFELFDNRGKGYIDSAALIDGMKSLGYQIDKRQISQMIDFLDNSQGDKKGVITKQSFKRFMSNRLDCRDPQYQIKNAFQFYDQDGRGKITLADLKRVAQQLGEDLEQCEAILKEGDKDQDGFLSYEEFTRIIKKTSYGSS